MKSSIGIDFKIRRWFAPQRPKPIRRIRLIGAFLTESRQDSRPAVHVLHGATRGGVTSALTEIVRAAIVGMLLGQASISISGEVNGAYEIPELDPPFADGGKLLAIIATEDVGLPLQDAWFAFVRQGCYFVALHADATIAQQGSTSRE